MSKAKSHSNLPNQSHSWSFAKASRFIRGRNTSADFVLLPSSFSRGRATGFGYGKRWEPKNQVGKDSPPVTRYSLNSGFGGKKTGPSFGRLGHARLPVSCTPGPGQYSPTRNIGDEGPKYTLKPRLTKVLKSETPSPDHYTPNVSILSDRSYSNVTFGIGSRRSQLHSGTLHSDPSLPGPGAYNLPSIFKGRSLPRRIPI